MRFDYRGMNMKKIVALFVMAQCGVLFAATASETPAEKRANQPVKFAITVGAQYTDNRDALPEKESNVDLYVTPMLALDLKWEETMLALTYAPSFRYRNSPNDYENKSQLFHDLALNFNHKLTPSLEFRLLDNFNMTDDPSVQQNGSTLRRDYSFTRNQVELGGKYTFSRLSNVDLVGRYMKKTYDDATVRTESDEDRTDAGLTFWHQPAKHFALTASANYSKYGYEMYNGVDRGFDSILLGIGLDDVFSPNLRCGINGGIQNVNYVNESLGSDSAPYVNVFAQVTTTPSTHITASVSKMIRESFIFPFASQDMTDFSLRLDWTAPTPELQLAFTGSYRLGDYSSSTIADSSASIVQDNVTTYGLDLNGGSETTYVLAAEVGYTIGFGTKIKFVQMYEKVDSDVRYSFDRNSSNIMLTREF